MMVDFGLGSGLREGDSPILLRGLRKIGKVPDRFVLIVAALTTFGVAAHACAGENVRLSGDVAVARKSPHVRYDVGDFWTYVHVPRQPGKNHKFGLLVFIDSKDLYLALPPGWDGFLEKNHLIYACPQGAGNKVPSDIRVGRAVVAAHRLMKQHAIDPDRVYVSGFSGGARMACIAAFYQPDLFRGVMPMAGAMYPVSTEYGSFQTDAASIASAHKCVRFALIAHQGDYRYNDIMAVFNQGFRKNNFQATTIQVPGKKHGYASAESMQKALEFVQATAPHEAKGPKVPKPARAAGKGG